MLVTMKQSVLDRAGDRTPAPRRRGRRAGIIIGVIALLGLGATSGGVALGMIPQPFAAAPAPAPSPTTIEPSETPTESSAPVIERPTVTPTPTSTRRPYALDDPSTWTMSGSEVGPIALGGDFAAETDDLQPTYTLDSAANCPNPDVAFFTRGDAPRLVVTRVDGKVDGVQVGLNAPSDTTSGRAPTTAEDAGLGSTVEQLKALYPDLHDAGAYGTDGAFALWSIERGGRFITFELDGDGARVGTVWVGSTEKPPYEFCG
ncbi:hypothetical protein ASG04_02830 [Curtobacterium sp. Leaf183]|nr:hypothetical protein ASG04_02830 [Curtobacterium sp. Leaf183]